MDVDYAGCKITRRSTSGWCAFLGNNLFVWGSKKQTVDARSVEETEHWAVAQGLIEIVWLKSLFHDLGFSCSNTPILWCDNLAANSISENPIFHSRTKHIEIDVHFVRENVEYGAVEIRYVPTMYQVADIFTKGLPKDRFLFLCSKLGLKMTPVYQLLPVAEAALQNTSRRS